MLTDIENDNDHMKNVEKMLYHLFYVDNGSFTSSNKAEINWVYNNLNAIFNPYGFNIQQVMTNEVETQCCINDTLCAQKFIF